MSTPRTTCLPIPHNTNHIVLFRMNESKGLELVAHRQNPAHWYVLFGPHSVFKIWITCQPSRIRKFYTKSQFFLKGPLFHEWVECMSLSCSFSSPSCSLIIYFISAVFHLALLHSFIWPVRRYKDFAWGSCINEMSDLLK